MKSVLFVCLGNICRSPTGEGVFQHFVEQTGRAHDIKIDSAGTIDYHTGNPADSRMIQHASRRGYQLTSRSRKVNTNDLQEFDLVIAMDRNNHRDLLAIENQPSAELKLLSHFLDDQFPVDVPDPYYGGPAGFETVLDMIEAACPSILKHLDTKRA
jgi:protein-tyrosine phosphatase